MTEPLESAVNETLWRMPERLATHIQEREARQFGGVHACFGALPSGVGNRVFVFDTPAPDDLEAAVTWLAVRDVPFQVTATAPVAADIADVLAGLDLEETRESPGMALESLDSVPSNGSSPHISEVTDADGRQAFESVFADAFDASQAFVDQLLSPAVVADDAFAHLVAHQDGQPVACGVLLRRGDAAGVFCVGVPPAFRRQGLGAAMTWAVLRAGRNGGCTVGVLDSTEMGFPLYREMGFETVVEYHHFEPTA